MNIGRLRVALTALLLALSLPTMAQDYPNKPVRINVPYPVGGASDITARLT